MSLHVLPVRTGGAAENMAADFLLLQRYTPSPVARFRHYDWRGPAFTFGYSQKISFVREQLPRDARVDLCRRPTGGGVVDHREDWTYALVIPRGHPLEAERAAQSYRVVHECLAHALAAQQVPAVVKQRCETEDDCSATANQTPGVCFQRAELYDVVHSHTGAKIAGAAQKRNKQGLLFQGSLWRPAAGASAVDWEQFHDDFTAQLASALGSSVEPAPWPDFNEDEVSGLTEQYSSPEWLEYR